jgi:hypothetical protein
VDIASLGRKAFDSKEQQRRTFTLGRLINDNDGSTEYYKTNGKKRIKANENSDIYSTIRGTKVLDPKTGRQCRLLDDSTSFGPTPLDAFTNAFPFKVSNTRKILLVVMPQLGDFDSAEYAELLKFVLPDLQKANIELRIVGIGNANSAKLFSLHTGVPLENIFVDPDAALHRKLKLHRGPNWDIPSWIPDGVLDWFANDICRNSNRKIPSKDIARAWMNYMAMCAGVAAPGTLQEILRGYIGDRSAPERLRPNEKVAAGPIVIRGVTDVKLGPIQYQSLWKNQKGYLRPAELATVRLRSMVEVLTKFKHYVPDQRYLDYRGGTFLFERNAKRQDFDLLYEYRDRGVLTYSETPSRPLSFLSSFIGLERARNPMRLRDPDFLYDD